MYYHKFQKIITSITIVTIIISIMSGCDRNLAVEDNLKDQIEEYKAEIEQLKQKITTLEVENKDLNKQVGELSIQNPNGLKMEERRKALVEKEAHLKIKEDALVKKELLLSEREKSVHKEEKKINIEYNQFVNQKQKDFKNIGEAEEMRRNYKKLQEDKAISDNRANNWLIWFSILGLIVFFSIIGLVIQYMRIKEKNRERIKTFDILNTINLSNEDKKLLTNSLGQFE